MTTQYQKLAQTMQEDDSVSTALKTVAREWDKRDTLDALRDAELLVLLFQTKFNNLANIPAKENNHESH